MYKFLKMFFLITGYLKNKKLKEDDDTFLREARIKNVNINFLKCVFNHKLKAKRQNKNIKLKIKKREIKCLKRKRLG